MNERLPCDGILYCAPSSAAFILRCCRFAGSVTFSIILSQREHQLELNRLALRCLFDRFVCLIDNRAAVVCLIVPRASSLKFRRQGEGVPPKIASPLRRNMPAQIFYKIDRYVSFGFANFVHARGVRLVRSRRTNHTCIYGRYVIASARRQDLARADSVA
jgi:hypothetical protein